MGKQVNISLNTYNQLDKIIINLQTTDYVGDTVTRNTAIRELIKTYWETKRKRLNS